ncbi:MAG TPA: hypothetical protein VHD14_03875 [Pseudolabrys sp.]|nr:hypothetical protein [Pseudolabrys sp.]
MRHIDSITQLEALLLLRANSEKRWDVPHVAARLYSSEDETREVLTRLNADGLLSHEEGRYRYSTSGEMQTLVDRTAEVYRRHLIPVTNVIHAKSPRIREFANAFKFRKDK